MVFDAKSVRSCDLVAKANDFIAGKLDQLPALGAIEVVVLGVPVVELVHAATVQFESVQKARVDELLEGSIYCRSGDVVRRSARGELLDEQICIEMLVPIEDLFEQKFLLQCVPKAPSL